MRLWPLCRRTERKDKNTLMKILHTGDIHLDSPFAGLPAKYAEERRRDIREAFSGMMRYAKNAGVDMVLIAGDLFETPFVTRETVALLRRDFSELQCPIIITPGNHDPAHENSIWMKKLFPKNVYVLKSPELCRISFDYLNCDVYGWAFTSSNMGTCPLSDKHPMNPDRINIVVGHGDTTSPIGNKCPIPPAVIRAFGADYCALAHLHNPENANSTLAGAAYYCGCIEGRDFGECGIKGAIVADVEKGDVRTQFVRFSNKTYRIEEIRVDGASDMGEISDRMQYFIDENNITSDTLLRIVLTGAVDPALVIDTALLSNEARGPFYTEVRDNTMPTWNGDALMGDRGIRGEVYRELLPALEGADGEEREKAARALRYALASLNGENISDI